MQQKTGRTIHRTLRVCLFAAAASLAVLAVAPAFALSEIPEEDITPPPDVITVPLPPPLANPANEDDQAEPDDAIEDNGGAPAEADAPRETPEIFYDAEKLPEPVRRMRELIMAACKAGDIEALRPLLDTGENGTMVTDSDPDIDPIEFLKSMSGDGEGHEILAILEEVLEAGYVHLDAGEPEDIYLWPYFFAVPLDSLTGRQQVELFRLVTAGDYEDMKSIGSYIFYRVGITPEGRWAFFVAGH